MEAPKIIWNAGHDQRNACFYLLKCKTLDRTETFSCVTGHSIANIPKLVSVRFFPVMLKSDSVQLSSVSSKYLILLYYNITMQITWFSLRNNNNINLYVALPVWK